MTCPICKHPGSADAESCAYQYRHPKPSPLATGSRPFFRAGDVVKHGPTGETWVLANDEEVNRVSPCGWPCCLAEASDCTLVEAATDAKRLETLTRLASCQVDERDGYDHRVSTAKHQLSANT